MFLRIESVVRKWVTSVTRWLITPHTANRAKSALPCRLYCPSKTSSPPHHDKYKITKLEASFEGPVPRTEVRGARSLALGIRMLYLTIVDMIGLTGHFL